ncbi:hypothetical protein ACPYO6_04060 [Georgenia sp. Z1344]|uniref:hypothetical protein n=1 Tax=Georgenia sp. Z1344 TaxID=3416706 RepID=UPI003CE991C0
MPHDPSSYGAAPPPGRASTNPYGSPPSGGPAAGSDVEAMRVAADASPWAPVATRADHEHPRAAQGYGRHASPWSWHSLRPRVGATLHGLVRIGRWLLLPLLVMLVVAIVLHSRMSNGRVDVPLDGTPTSVTVERGSDVWLWVPEDAPGVDCSATDSEGLGLEPRWLLRQLTNDDLVSALVMPSGSTGTFEIACEPADDGQLVPAPATAHVGVAPAPSADRVAAYYTLTRVSTAGLVVVGAATVVLWILWGVLRAARVLPRLR